MQALPSWRNGIIRFLGQGSCPLPRNYFNLCENPLLLQKVVKIPTSHGVFFFHLAWTFRRLFAAIYSPAGRSIIWTGSTLSAPCSMLLLGMLVPHFADLGDALLHVFQRLLQAPILHPVIIQPRVFLRISGE